ncbi:MAG: hypothetical protein ACTHNS_13300 [Marmoricola sp.]
MRTRLAAAVPAALLCSLTLAGTLTGCTTAPEHPPRSTVAGLRTQEQQLLDQRARGLMTHDRALFLRGVDRSDRGFVRRQERYFANLTQLPLATLGYTVLGGRWPDPLQRSAGGRPMPRVRLSLQLDGYDSAPEHQIAGFVFARRHGRLRIVSDRTPAGAFFPGYRPQPWDLTRVHVVAGHGVLGVFDDAMRSEAHRLLDVVAGGVRQVQQTVPFVWDGRVVVYLFDERSVLDSFASVPGGNIRHLGALSFPVYAGEGHDDPVGMRFTLLPSSVEAGEPFLGRIVRHELTHVAVGARDDGVPVWFAEGLAEYVGARPLPRAQQRIAAVALERAHGMVTAMPSSRDFNGPDQDWHYALSWMACDEIAATRGEDALWRLMDALHNGGAGTPDGRQDAVLDRVLGYDSHELARRAAARIRHLYG